MTRVYRDGQLANSEAGVVLNTWATDSNGQPLHFRVARYSAEGAWLGAFGEPGEGGGAFARPKAVAVDGAGAIWVSDAGNDVVPGSRFKTSAGLMPRVIKNIAMSPTTLLLGVTFTMSPKSIFTSA